MQYVEILRKLGCDVYFLYLDLYEGRFKGGETEEYWGDHYFSYSTPTWQIFCQKIRRRIEHRYYFDKVDVYYPHGLTRYVNTLNAKCHFDGLIVNYVWASKLAECNIPTKAIFTHDVFTNRNHKLKGKDSWYSFTQAEEAKAVARFTEVLSIQNEETEWFRSLAPNSNVRTVYSSFDFVEQPIQTNKNILFFSGGGKLNKQGIDRFINEVWPMLKAQDDEMRLLLGGNICSCFNETELEPGIILKGRYDNPDDFYALGDICINPVFEGSGLKIKTFEALAHGKITIVDPHSAIGVYQPENIPLYRAKNPQDYVDVIKQFMCKENALEKKQEECKAYIKDLNNYILQQYEEVFN